MFDLSKKIIGHIGNKLLFIVISYIKEHIKKALCNMAVFRAHHKRDK